MKKTYKKYVNATVATFLVGSGTVVVGPIAEASTTFPDVKSSHFFYDAINSLAEREVINGFPDGTFKPNQSVTRGQAAKIIAGVLGLNTKNGSNPGFKDVTTANPYFGEIAALANAGIIDGFPDGTYKPDAPVQRNHMAKIIAKAFNLEPSSDAKNPFTDVDVNYVRFVTALYENRVTTGSTAAAFNGNANVTRGQLAAFVIRAENVNETTITINDISGSTITSGNKTYEVATVLQGLLSESNKQVLKSAVIKAKVENNQIVTIESLELNAAGKQDALITFDGKNTTIPSLSVNADFVQVKNLTVLGNVTVTVKVSNEFSANTLKVNGELIIEASNNPIASLAPIAIANTGLKANLENSTVGKFQVQREGVVISSDNRLTEVVVFKQVKTIEIDANVTKVTINSIAVTIKGKGTISELVVSNTDAKVELGTNVKIKKLVIPKGVSPESVITNFNQVKTNILQILDTEGKTISKDNSDSNWGSSDRTFPDITIITIEPVRFTVEQNSVFNLPQTVVTRYSDGTTRNTSVVWDLKTVNTAIVGTQLIEGTVEGYGEKVQLLLEVKAPTQSPDLTITNIETLGFIVEQNSEFYLPQTVVAQYSDGTTGIVEVVWDQTTVDTEKVGTQTIEGTVKGYGGKVQLILEVKAPTVTDAPTIETLQIIVNGENRTATSNTDGFELEVVEGSIISNLIITMSENVKLSSGDRVLIDEMPFGTIAVSSDDSSKLIITPNDSNYTLGKLGEFTLNLAEDILIVDESEKNLDVSTLTVKLIVTSHVEHGNVQGALRDSSGFVGSAMVAFYNESTKQTIYTNITSDGLFSEELPDGEYTIEYIYSDAFDHVYDVKVNTEYDRFTIDDGILLINGTEAERLNLSVPPVSLKIQILHNGVPVQGNVFVYSDNLSHQWNAAKTNGNGELILRVPNGEYTIDSFNDVGNNYPINRTVTANPDSPEAVVIDLENGGNTHWYSGIVQDENGPINLGQLFIEDSNGINVVNIVVDANGNFTFNLPDGNYFIKSISDNIPLQIKFSILDGLLYQNETVTDQLVVTLSSLRVQGMIVDEYGEAIGRGKIGIINVNDHEIYNHYFDIDENGAFSLRLADGDYKVTAINQDKADYRFIPMQVAFSVQEGNLFVNGEARETLNLTLPLSNFKGQLLQLGQPLGSSFIYLFSEMVPKHFHSFAVITDWNGFFSRRLGDGNYFITGIDTLNQNVPNYTEFEINNGIPSIDFSTFDIGGVRGNVQGLVQTENGLVVEGGGILYLEEIESGEWYATDVTSTGEFGLELPDGDYEVFNFVSKITGFIDLHIEFSVRNGVLVDPLVISLPSKY